MTTSAATLPCITAPTLSSLILSQSPGANSSMAIIDVRDDDHIGGHIIGSSHVPSATLDDKLPDLVRNLRDKETVVFHCALSQQRGPGAALRYLRERERLLGAASKVDVSREAGEKSEVDVAAKEGVEENVVQDQKVYVLERGFVGWQEKFGEDERLTESYSKELWKGGYWE